ncbi:hypothetical protein GWK48_10225 [Metallosphaera tengchongensis]|uniref:Blue (type 1) copper domain-containing protein n=1 Tax=Metallosphaera tengchongensis TaxID=1532350 RepID=A0A6N0NXW5_9CREN|nr:plastocyanin/azurin family copper-binding protein [Metallosphaera tengchongensis]QKR00713.1 hypothetical protein GWK48_10225 [Metallosphaera tengchongensis]
MNKILLMLILVVALGLVVTYSYTQIYIPRYYAQQSVDYYNQQLGMMGYYGGSGMMGGMMGGYGMGSYNGYATAYAQRIPIQQAEVYVNFSSPSAEVFRANDTVVLTGNNVNLVILSMGHGRAFNLTHYAGGAHAQDNVFVTYGLVNPTIIVPVGSEVHITLINLDEGDYHNLAITPVPPPYPYYSMMDVRMDVLGMTPMLPPANYGVGMAYEFSFSTVFQTPGTYYYICEYPGHAQMGMYGEIEVV